MQIATFCGDDEDDGDTDFGQFGTAVAAVPVVTELSPNGRLILPPDMEAPSGQEISDAIRRDRDRRIANLRGK